MSRVSSKSSLSPSASRGSNAIDLGKDSGVDMGQKSQVSVSTGGIGVTQEVASIGGVSVTAGVGVEILPLGIDISGDPNYEDPSKSTVSVSASAEIPGGLLGFGAGVTINTSTGEVVGGSIGGELLGLGVNVSNSPDGIGLGLTLQIPFTPIELELGFAFPKKTPTPTPPTSTQTPIRRIPNLPIQKNGCGYYVYWEAYVVLGNDWVNNYGGGYSIAGGRWRYLGDAYIQPKGQSGGYVYDHFEYYDTLELNPGSGAAFTIEGYGGEAGRKKGKKAESNEFPFFYESSPKEGKITTTDIRYVTPFYVNNNCPALIFSPPSNSSPDLLPPNPPPRKNMDECCRESIKLLRQIHKGLGIAKFPGKLPVTIIQQIPKKGERPAEPAQVPIADFVDLLDWQFKRDDERWGQWEVQIDIKDSDLTKEGDQSKSIKLPNLAESIAEIEGQLLSVMTNVDALVAMQTKCLVESGMARQEAIKGYLASKAIIKYMAFKSTEIDVTVPMSFTAGAETISELVKESEGHIKGTDYTEKETLRDILLDLLQSAAVIRAVHWQRINTKTDTKSQLLGLLKGSVDLANSLTKPTNTAGDNGSDKFDPTQNFEDFIDSVEDGFTNSTGITDIQNPYGKTRDRRPRIRQIGDNISQAGGK